MASEVNSESIVTAERSVLHALGRDGALSYPELATVTRLSPLVLKRVVESLKERNLVGIHEHSATGLELIASRSRSFLAIILGRLGRGQHVDGHPAARQ